MGELRRPSSKPRAEIERFVAAAIEEHGGPDYARAYYKYDCAGCDRRVRVAEANVLPRRARCAACGAWTEIERAGMALEVRLKATTPWATPDRYIVARKPYTEAREETWAWEFER